MEGNVSSVDTSNTSNHHFQLPCSRSAKWQQLYLLGATWTCTWSILFARDFEQTYVDISWHKRLRRCTWLWGCAPTGKTLGCRRTAGGTGSHTLRCRWNLCTPEGSTQPRLAEGRGHQLGLALSITAAFHLYIRSRHVMFRVSFKTKREKNWSHWSTDMM